MRLLLLPVLAALALTSVPAQADPAIQTCGDDDYQVAYVKVGEIEVAEVCTSIDPRDLFVIGCDICQKLDLPPIHK